MASRIVVNLDTSKENFLLEKCIQFDNITLEANIFENGKKKSLANHTVIISVLKPDGTFTKDVPEPAEMVDNKITKLLDEQATTADGMGKVMVTLTDNNNLQNSTFEFKLLIKKFITDGAVASATAVPIVKELTDKITEAIKVKNDTDTLIKQGGAARGSSVFTTTTNPPAIDTTNTNNKPNDWHINPNTNVFSMRNGNTNWLNKGKLPTDVVNTYTGKVTDALSADRGRDLNTRVKLYEDAFPNTYKGKRLIILSDDQSMTNTHKTKIWWEWVRDILGFTTVTNESTASSSLSKINANDTNSMTVRWEKFNNVDKATVGAVIVMGGAYDLLHNVPLGHFGDSADGTVYGAIYYLCDKLRANFPYHKIFFVTPTEQNNEAIALANTTGITTKQIAQAIKEVCTKFSISVYDANVNVGITPLININQYSTDRLNLNNGAQQMLGVGVAGWILAGHNSASANAELKPYNVYGKKITFNAVLPDNTFSITGLIRANSTMNGKRLVATISGTGVTNLIVPNAKPAGDLGGIFLDRNSNLSNRNPSTQNNADYISVSNYNTVLSPNATSPQVTDILITTNSTELKGITDQDFIKVTMPIQINPNTQGNAYFTFNDFKISVGGEYQDILAVGSLVEMEKYTIGRL